ncbi:SDR family NAD(P)-dependent oxidoreductase [Pelagovum pacificum]|uniref:SDR family oxidoreductase n=1 Tax=Pelagovum pacificum TaxID=2588711 RepID=A0A5C5G7R4_9RHOB|nr:SDR family oxidoreductase [Pelagovum pacificum]QQA41804.1 SDR family oxidoreductase [Pelagovum pacificum]TNY30754.1 SDR family oxidoreductase [Pelagovum pacificum]
MAQLDGQIAVVTGASGGIGAAIAKALADAGATVWGVARDEGKLKEAIGDTCKVRSVDLTDQASVEKTFTAIREEEGRIDILFNNAGRFHSLAGVHECDVDDWWMDMTVNVKGILMSCRTVLPMMMEAGTGTIINMNGGRPIGGTAYASSKAAVVQMTELMAKELEHLGRSDIRVLLANPGLVMTEMTEYQRDTPGGQFWIPGVGEALKAGNTRKPEEIAAMTVRMLGEATVSDNGRMFDPDGWVA